MWPIKPVWSQSVWGARTTCHRNGMPQATDIYFSLFWRLRSSPSRWVQMLCLVRTPSRFVSDRHLSAPLRQDGAGKLPCLVLKISNPIYGAFSGSSVVKNLPTNAGDTDLISGSGRCPEIRNGNLLQYSCLETSLDGRAWRATVHRVKKSRTP